MQFFPQRTLFGMEWNVVSTLICTGKKSLFKKIKLFHTIWFEGYFSHPVHTNSYSSHQDLPNNMIHQVPIKSLPQEWLWCETWCDDSSKKRAKTIDLVSTVWLLQSYVTIEWPILEALPYFRSKRLYCYVNVFSTSVFSFSFYISFTWSSGIIVNLERDFTLYSA